MWKIWKYKFPIKDEFELELPAIHEILKVGMQDIATPTMWVIVEPNAVKVTRKFRVFGTGHPIPGGPLCTDSNHNTVSIQQPGGGHIRYVDTFFQDPFVWHLFEVIKVADDQ